MEELLRMERVSKRFGNFYANKNINLSVSKGEVHTLLGENGAGKSTLMNILIGLYQPSEGHIFFKGEEIHLSSPADAVRLGIGMVHQHFMLVDSMTVFENIILGDKNSKGIFIDKLSRRKEIEELSAKYGLDIELDKLINDISVGSQQRVEILKALYHGADLLVLDEPSAALTDIEVEGLFAIIHKLVAEGKSIIFISHKMREVLRISDRISILRAGELVETVNCADVTGPQLANMMIGRELTEAHYDKTVRSNEIIAELDSVSFNKSNKHNGLNSVSLTVHKGEIVGIAGVDGNGQTQLAQLLTGVIKPDEGNITINGNKISLFEPATFIKKGVSHIPEDRNLQGLVGDMSIAENIILKSSDSVEFSSAHGLKLKHKGIKQFANDMINKYDIRCMGPSQPVRNLSGGNQQKVIFAREMEANPDLLIAAHPTRGLDIGAARYVHDAMNKAKNEGAAILLISADFDEVLEVSDRILVLFEGRIMGEYSGKKPPVEEISLAMTGK